MLLGCPSVLVGQTSPEEIEAEVQKLEKRIASATETERPILILEFARLVQRTDPERAIALATEILDATDLRLAADAYKTKGLGHLRLDQHAESLAAMRKAESLFRELGEELEMSSILEAALFNLAEAHARLGDHRRAHQLLEEEPAELTETRSDLSDDLSNLVVAMLNKDPSRRPRCDEILHRLTRIEAA